MNNQKNTLDKRMKVPFAVTKQSIGSSTKGYTPVLSFQTMERHSWNSTGGHSQYPQMPVTPQPIGWIHPARRCSAQSMNFKLRPEFAALIRTEHAHTIHVRTGTTHIQAVKNGRITDFLVAKWGTFK